jgi:ABC-type dipeptide/oligopeptide/nickel transport system permease component
MKKALYLVMVMGVLVIFGCMQSKPEDAAKAYMNQQIPAHQGLDLDTSGLKYELVEETAGSAKVLVSGDIAVEAELNLVKTGGKWTLAGDAPEAVEAEKPAETRHSTAD